MKHLFNLTIISFIILSLFSCEKEEDVIVEDTTVNQTDTTDEETEENDTSSVVEGTNYYPTTIGNKYTYSSSQYGTYTVEYTGTEMVSGVEYTTIETVMDSGTTSSLVLSNANEVTVIAEAMQLNTGKLSLKILDKTKSLYSSWVVGNVSVDQSGVMSTTDYTAKFTDKLSALEVNGVTYEDVIEITMTTTTSISLSEVFKAQIGEQAAALLENSYASQNISISQKTYYANNVGMIKQTSDDYDILEVMIVSAEI
jgi:hypothetical protein